MGAKSQDIFLVGVGKRGEKERGDRSPLLRKELEYVFES